MSTLPTVGTAAPRVHAIVVTFRRNAALAETLAAIGGQTRPPDTLTVADNAADPATASLARRFGAAYQAMSENLGPAGALAHVMTSLLPQVDEDDWLLIVDDDNPPQTSTTVEDILETALSVDPTVAAVGCAGGWFSRRSGLLRRPPDDALVGLVDVDAIGGGQFPIYRASAVRRSGPVRADLFFGFEELEFGLRLQNHGYRLVVPADVWLQSRHVLGRTGMNARQAAGVRTTSAWRRYYSVRNLIWISRTHGGPIAPLVATIRSGLFSAAADVWRGRSVRAAYPAVRGMMDAWRGRLGAVVVPEGYGENVLPEVGTAGVD